MADVVQGVLRWILYGNSHLKVDQYHTRLTSYFTHQDLPSDIVKITGPMFKEQKMFYTNFFLAGRRTSVIGTTDDDVVFPPMDVSPPGCWVLLAGMVAIYLLLCHSIYRLTLSQWFRRRVEPVATLVPVQVTIAMRYVAVTLASYTYLLHRIHCSSGNLDPVSTRCNIDYVPVSSSDLSPWMPTQPSKNKTSWRFWVSFSCQTSINIVSLSASFPIEW